MTRVFVAELNGGGLSFETPHQLVVSLFVRFRHRNQTSGRRIALLNTANERTNRFIRSNGHGPRRLSNNYDGSTDKSYAYNSNVYFVFARKRVRKNIIPS